MRASVAVAALLALLAVGAAAHSQVSLAGTQLPAAVAPVVATTVSTNSSAPNATAVNGTVVNGTVVNGTISVAEVERYLNSTVDEDANATLVANGTTLEEDPAGPETDTVLDSLVSEDPITAFLRPKADTDVMTALPVAPSDLTPYEAALFQLRQLRHRLRQLRGAITHLEVRRSIMENAMDNLFLNATHWQDRFNRIYRRHEVAVDLDQADLDVALRKPHQWAVDRAQRTVRRMRRVRRHWSRAITLNADQSLVLQQHYARLAMTIAKLQARAARLPLQAKPAAAVAAATLPAATLAPVDAQQAQQQLQQQQALTTTPVAGLVA